jgi:GntR family transcriptional regulator, transcriptional repressor for pyruvate dehydrogenase complex
MKTFTPVIRTHAADHIYEALARSILRGELGEGHALPPERILSEQFGVSRIIARQAVHRLAEVGLVEVRQGGKTLVKAFSEFADLRALMLLYRFCPEDPNLAAEIFEKQYLQGLALVDLALRHAQARDCKALAAMVERAKSVPELEETFWRALARIGNNRVLAVEVAWWYENMPQRQRPASEHMLVHAFYTELTKHIANKSDAIDFYRSALAPSLARRSAPASTGACRR